jgi:hypothetical protein
MPVEEINRLTRDSSDAQINAAVSACVAQEVRNGRDQDQAVAMCYSQAREKTGKELGRKEQ